jgi:GntR family transcriptional regulator
MRAETGGSRLVVAWLLKCRVKHDRPLTSSRGNQFSALEMQDPLYKQLADTLREKIQSGAFNENAPLPPERELAQQHGMSRETVRKALRLLDEAGLIYSDQGRGTFVTAHSLREMAGTVGSFTLDTRKRGGTPGQKILEFKKTAAGLAMANVMHVTSDTELLYVKRLRYINNNPVGIQTSWVALPEQKKIGVEQLARKGSLYRLLVEDLGLSPSMAIENLGAVSASGEDADLLEVEAGSPILLCERITLSDRRVPIEFCEMRYGPSYRYKNKVTDWGKT